MRFVIIIAVLWLLVWLLFFRDTSKPTKPHSTGTKQGQPAGGQTSTNSGATQPPNTNSGNATNGQPTQLVNTGAGNVLIPAVVATLAGGVFYQVRLHKKLSS